MSHPGRFRASATASGGGVAVGGVHIDQSVRQDAPRQAAEWPHTVGSPPGWALCFQGRAEAARLRTTLETEGTAVIGQVPSGLGGLRKTQLAADYATTAFRSGSLDVLVWVTAASRQSVLDGYTRAAVDSSHVCAMKGGPATGRSPGGPGQGRQQAPPDR